MNDKNLDLIASEIFEKIRGQFPKIRLSDENGAATSDPSAARMFEFPFQQKGADLGTVTLSIADDKGIVVLFSNDMLDRAAPGTKQEWFNFLRELREFSRQRFLNFNIRDITKSNLEKRDLIQLSKEKQGEARMSESKLWGTTKVSNQLVGEARLIIKHSVPINLEEVGARARKIGSIYIENSQGERFKYPYKHLNGARAMARHVSNNGTPYDAIGEHIIGLSEELSKLRMFKRYVERNDMISEAMSSINPKVLSRISEIKKEISGLQSQSNYQTFAESFVASEAKEIPEDIVNDWIDRLTVRSFNEDLKTVFPFIFKLVNEDDLPPKTITLEELVDDDISEKVDSIFREIANGEIDIYDVYSANPELPEEKEVQEKIHKMYDEVADKHNLYPSDDFNEILNIVLDQIKKNYGGSSEPVESQQFESLLNLIVAEDSDLLSDDEQAQSAAIEKLKELVQQAIPVGPDGTNAIESLDGIIDDSELNDIFKELADMDPEFDARPIIKDYLRIHDEENGTDISSHINFENDAPAEPEEPTNTEPNMSTDLDAELGALANTPAAPAAPAAAPQQVNADIDHKLDDGMKNKDEIHEFVESMFDKETGNFPKGETGVLLSVEKKFGPKAVHRAKRAIEHLVSVTESYRIKKLAGLNP